MKIGQPGVGVNLSSQKELWSLVKARREALHHRSEGLGFVEERLGGLLLGQQLSPAQQGDYVRRLAGTAALAAQIGRGPEVPDLQLARIPKERLLWKAGGMTWRPFPVSARTVVVTPLHRRLQDRLALALRDKRAGDVQSVRTCVHAVGITVDRGSFSISSGDQDRVEMTGWGLEMLTLEKTLSKPPTLPPPPRILLATVGPSPSSSFAS